jgi:cellulose synthase/poly-beta-1,6-N-acetylglucosamine synthase-like glycosyltransferase
MMRREDGVKKQEKFSVMIPTFEPSRSLLDAIQSVLKQFDERVVNGTDLSKDSLQITVVDDASSTVDVSSLLKESGLTDRVEFVKSGKHLGLAGNWNYAVSLARADLVHLLHQDDCVERGFYQQMWQAFQEQPGLGMACCRSKIVDDKGRVVKKTSRLRWQRGVLDAWLSRIGERQRVQCPSVVVKKATYAAIGGFRPDLIQTLDWEMWVRIAGRFPVWYEPRSLAVYRRHKQSESSRLLASDLVWPDIAKAITINSASFPAELRRTMTSRSACWHAKSCLRNVKNNMRLKNYQAAERTLGQFPKIVTLVAEMRIKNRLDRRADGLRRRIQRLRAS